MASKNLIHFTENQSKYGQEASEEDKLSQECKELILSLPREKGWRIPYFYLFQGFWCSPDVVEPIDTLQKHFQAKDNDVVVTSLPKSGTTWLKSLTFAIVNRQCFSSMENHPLLTLNSHQLVPFFEYAIYSDALDHIPSLSNITEPRLFGTHIPFPSLPKSIKESNCRIIYICRNPFDHFVSTWIYLNKLVKPEPTLTIEEAFEKYCKGTSEFGPFWNHMLGYLKESIARPDKVLFLKYEDLKEDVKFHVKKMAEFLGCPFTQEEECSGVIENIIKLCSFENMKELDVNKFGTLAKNIENRNFFRKAKIGDWVNYLYPSMVEQLSQIMEAKLSGSGLSFRVCSLDTTA